MADRTPKVEEVYQIKAIRVEGDRPAYYNVGKVTFFDDGTVKMRLNHIPNQEYRLFRNRDDRGKGE